MHDIDFVITWVDGNDPAWIAERQKYKEDTGDQRAERFRDWGLLRYWFRSVEKYAPWVRKIHFVTWGHVPEWLDTSHPKLHIVKHEDFIPPEYLPTFNSHTIELNLHRIEGLAEHFVYFNDDMFLTKETPPDFFFKNGLPRDCFGLDDIYFGPNSIGWINGANIAVINKHFNLYKVVRRHWHKILSPKNGIKKVIKTCMHVTLNPWFPGLAYWHLTTAYNKTTFENVWKKEEAILSQTCRCHFRENTNVSPWLFKYWQLATGNFEPMTTKNGRCYHLTNNLVENVCRAIKGKNFNVICINDSGRIKDTSEAIPKIQAAFENKLSDNSSFEKKGE